MSRSSRRRAQVEPLAALAAVFAVCLGLTAYAGVLDATLVPTDRNLAEPTIERVHDALRAHGSVQSGKLSASLDASPDGYDVNVTVTSGVRRWSVGPTPSEHADSTRRFVSVATAPGEVRSGWLRVEVWS